MNRLILIVFVLWLMHGALAQPSLVKNINTTTATGGLEFSGAMAVLNGDLYFGAKAQGDGYELWKSPASGGAVMVTNLTGDPGINSVYNFNGTLYFMATNAATGTELWKSNGTEAGTMMVKDIWPGTTGGCAQTLGIVNIGNTIYFAASDGAANGFELWKSDGTAAGTTIVKNINASGSGFNTGNYSLIAIGTTLYFTASDGSTVGTELYKSDGTAANTVLVKDVNPSVGGNGTGGNFTNFNGKLLFSGSDATNGVEPWISDGTTAGTVMLKNIAALAASSVSLGQEYTVSGSYAYFAAQEAVNGVELWRTDGTAAGTTLVKDIYAGASNHGAPSGIVNVNGVLYFTAQDGSGFELWTSDGTAANTQLVKDIASGAGSSYPARFTNQLSGKVFFTATEAITGTELWETDGTAAGTQLVYDINPLAPASTPRGLQVIGNQLLFTADDGVNGIELWSYTPGTPLAVPNTITTLVAAVRNANSIKLTWTDSDTETKYEIERSAGNASSFVKIAGADADINQYTAASLTPGTIYYFRIRQKNAAGYSSYSNVVSETIPVIPFPTIASMQLSSPNTLHLTWSDVPGVSGYNIERSIGNNTSYVQYTQIQSTDFNDADITGLTPGTTYYVRMNSYTVFPGAIVVTSAYSNEVSKLVPVTAPPAAPTGLTASINGSAVTLNWNDMPAESSYIIERSVNNTTSFSVVNNPSANAIQYIDNGITPGNTYYYRLAYVQAGQTSFYSQYTNYPSVISIPTVPQNVVATTTGPNEITLTWDEPSTATHYWLMWGSPSPVSMINPVSGNSRVFDGLEANTTYYFKILAVNATGESVYSTVANATTPAIAKVNSILISGAGNSTTITSNGGTLQMSVTVLPANATDKTVTWSVNNGSGSATITPSGLLTATGNGTVTVKALANDGSSITDAKVINISGQIVLANSIVVTGTANATTISTSGGTLQMNAAVLPASTTNKAVTWSVTNVTGSATITTAGLLTATGNGTVTVKAVAKDGSATNGTIGITISGQPASILVTSILVTGNDISVSGGTSQMNAAVSPGNSTVSSVTWSVIPGTGSATISATGLLTAISNGTVTVKATANDVSTVTGTKMITISNQKILVSSIVVSASGNAAGIYTVAGTLQMSAVVLPLNATDKTITWSVINGTGSAVISSNGLLTATGNGTVTVKASANDASEVTGTKIFTISGQAPSVLVTSILVSGADISVPGGTSQMAVSLLPANATVMSVTWSVINGTGKATISNTGLLTATDNGTVTVKALANDVSGISDTHVVTISGQNQTVLVTSIQIVSEGVLIGNSAVMTAALLPLHATVQSVTWSVVNGVGSATIDPATGELKALLAGTVTIKALANDGSMVTGTKVICILPAVPVITVDFKDAASPVLTSSSTSGNQWFLNGTPITDATHTTYTAIQPGLYTLQVTAETCPSALSEASEIVVTGLNKEEVAVSVVCVPNPASEFITIHAPATSYAKVFVYNLRGQLMMSGGGEYLNQPLSISDYPEGIYFARVQMNETTVVKKFIKK